MQPNQKKEILPNVFLRCIRTEKFKTGCLSVQLVTPLRAETASLSALLPRVLRRGTARYPNMESLAARLDELYGAFIEPVARKKGEVQSVGFVSNFVGDSYLPQGEGVLEKTASLVGEMLLEPATWGGRLRAEYVDSERDNLVDEIRAGRNEKRRYSMDRLTEEMCRDERYGVGYLGSESTAAKITAASLTGHYRRLLSSARLELFYCGEARPERVERALLEALSAIPRGEPEELPATEVVLTPPEGEPRTVTEVMDVTQGKLAMGFRMGETMKRPNYAAMMVFNALYGGAVTSKLFLNVRERLSLCYFASSMVDKHKGVMLVSSGVEFSKFAQARDEILAQLEEVKMGHIQPWELDGAKKAVVNSIRAAMDNQYRTEDLLFDYGLAGIECTPEEMAALAGEVTARDVTDVASGVKLDTVYFLTGERSGPDET